MDIVFTCPNCKQQLEADSAMSGNRIGCPSCGNELVIPAADATNVHAGNPIASSAAAKQEYHFTVPVRDKPTEVLIQKPNKPLEAAAKEGVRKMRIRCIRRTDCVEVGRDRFEEVVTEFLNEVGESNIISITPLAYTHQDIGTRAILTDYGVMVIYRA